MRTKMNDNRWYIGLFSILVSLLFCSPSFAAEIPLIGSDNPKVTNEQGVDVTHDNELDRYQYYNVTYTWQVPKGVAIHDGDTATFTVPNNVQVLYDTSFPVYDNDHHQVGEFTIKAGATTGTLTFNDYFATHHIDQNIHGTLTFTGVGKKTYEDKDWVINKSGWLDSHNQPVWDIVYNPEEKHLVDVEIHDELQGNQVLDPKSIEIQYGTVDQNNQFHMTGIMNPDQYQLTTTTDGFTLKMPSLDTAIQIIYHSQLPSPGDTVLNNKVTGSDQHLGVHQDTSSIQVTGSGSASGDVTPPIASTSSSEQTTTQSSSASESTSMPSSSEINSRCDASSTTTTSSSDVVINYPSSSSEEATTSPSIFDSTTTSTSDTMTTTSNLSTTSSSDVVINRPSSSSAEATTSTSLPESTTKEHAIINEGKDNTMTTTVSASKEDEKKQGQLPATGDDDDFALTIVGLCLVQLVSIAGSVYMRRMRK